MDCIDNEIDKWRCSKFTGFKMKRASGNKFVTDPAFMDEILSQPDYYIKNTYALDVDPNEIECDANVIKEFTKCFYDLGIT